jgi:hypothetical protein
VSDLTHLSDLPEVGLALQMLATKRGLGRIAGDRVVPDEWRLRLFYLNAMLKRLRLRGGFSMWRAVVVDGHVLNHNEIEAIGLKARVGDWKRTEAMLGGAFYEFI